MLCIKPHLSSQNPASLCAGCSSPHFLNRISVSKQQQRLTPGSRNADQGIHVLIAPCQHLLKNRNNTATAHGDTATLPSSQRTSACEWEAPKLAHLKVKALPALVNKQAKQMRENAVWQSHILSQRSSS